MNRRSFPTSNVGMKRYVFAMMTETENTARVMRAQDLGLAFARTMITLNSGAIVVLLAYMSNSEKTQAFTFTVSSLQGAFNCFLIGAISMAVAIFASYVHSAFPPVHRVAEWLEARIIAINGVLSLSALLSFFIGVLWLSSSVIEVL